MLRFFIGFFELDLCALKKSFFTLLEDVYNHGNEFFIGYVVFGLGLFVKKYDIPCFQIIEEHGNATFGQGEEILNVRRAKRGIAKIEEAPDSSVVFFESPKRDHGADGFDRFSFPCSKW